MTQEIIEDILHFWFEETPSKLKYEKNPEFDEIIRTKYLDAYQDIVDTRGATWRTTPEGSLAAIVVLDQFSRNMFRGDPQSFAEDALALEIAEELVAGGHDMQFVGEMRSAIYMPYMHSESKDVHEKALALFEKFANDTGEKSGLEYEIKHKAIIDRFGRYPHRNDVLGRPSTPEEIAFNEEHGGF